MSDAPERIWAQPRITAGWNDAIAGTRETCCGTEYTRTDLIPALLAEARANALREAAAIAMRLADYAAKKGAISNSMGALDVHNAILAMIDKEART
jgi:hypothetical protein